MLTKEEYRIQGKRNKRKGAEFELKVRKHLEEYGWVVDKWGKNVNLETNELFSVNSRFRGSGFPDFMAFQLAEDNIEEQKKRATPKYRMKFIECKFNGTLKRIEKEKLNWMVKEGHQCWVACDNNGEINYIKWKYKKLKILK